MVVFLPSVLVEAMEVMRIGNRNRHQAGLERNLRTGEILSLKT